MFRNQNCLFFYWWFSRISWTDAPHFGNQSTAGLTCLGNPSSNMGPHNPLSLPLFSTSVLTHSLHSLHPQTSNSVAAFFWHRSLPNRAKCSGCRSEHRVQGGSSLLVSPLTDTNADKPEEETEEDKNSPDCGDTRGGVEVSHSGAPAGVCAPISAASD